MDERLRYYWRWAIQQHSRSCTVRMELPSSELALDVWLSLIQAFESYLPFTLQRVFDKETCSHRWLLT